MRGGWIAGMFVSAVLAGCYRGVDEDRDRLPGVALATDAARNTMPMPTIADQLAMVADERAFALDLLHALSAGADNVVVSPVGLRVGFGMVHAGARTVSEAEIQQALHFTLERPALHGALDWIDLELANRDIAASGEVTGDDSVKLTLALALFGRDDVQWLQGFVDALVEYFGVVLHVLDFAGDPDGSRVAINGWVRGETSIAELLPAGSIVPEVTTVLVHALHLRAPWASPIDSVVDAVFTGLGGDAVMVPTMQGFVPGCRSLVGDGFEAAGLPLRGGALTMVVIVPDPGTFAAYVEQLDGPRLTAVFDALAPEDLDVALPKFAFTSAFTLKPALMQLGVVASFEPGGADFSGMADAPTALADVFHSTVIAVDGAGLGSAAATVGVEVDSDGALFGVPFVVDRPFLFAVVDLGTGALLLLGRVVELQP